jgi:hypothetical protein
MMLIQCTKVLLDKMGIGHRELQSPEGYEQFPDSLMAWHANLVNINRRKAIVLMNNETRYPVVIYRPKPKDFKKIKELIREAIKTALRMEGVRDDVIKNYLENAGEIRFSKTAGRSMVAKMNKAVYEIEYMQEYLDEKTSIQRYISIMTGRLIQNSLTEEWFYPIEVMLESLAKYSENDEKVKPQDILEVDLYQLKIQIDIEGFDIWRRVLVPSTYSFRHLHNIIQTVFDWQNYHLHKFEVKKDGSVDKMIVMDDDPDTLEWLDFDTYDVLQERFTALEDILPHGEVIYEYDFGDSWEHTISLEKVIKSNTFEATFMDGKGERPPEDVGGSGGYEEYMQIMADDTDPEHESMKIWSESQKERKLSQEQINDRLKRSIRWYSY